MKRVIFARNSKECHVTWLLAAFMALALVVGVLLLPNTVQTAEAATVASGTCSDNLTWTLDSEGTLTISGTGAIKNSANYASNSPWYSNRSSIKRVTIGEGVTSIGWRAFADCSSLKSITIPDSVRGIWDYAFYACRSLTSITIPDSVTGIGDYAFYDCSSLTSITIPGRVTSIGEYAFCKCSSLTSITIPDSVTSIENGAFSVCSSLTSITIPDSVTSIGRRAFSSCSSLASVTIMDGVTYIGDYAFENCTGLTSITIPGSVAPPGGVTTGICVAVFSGCSSLTNTTFTGSTVTQVTVRKLPYTRLTSITIGDGVTSVGQGAFSDCSSLTSITIPDSVTSIGSSAFSNCTGLTSITIPDSVTDIASYAFKDCTNLTSVYITDLGTWCGISFGSNSANPLYYAKNLYLNGELLTDAVIPDSVTSIGSGAFYLCSSLTSITIPDSVRSIGNIAFAGCTGLTSITIPGNMTSISDDAFSGCSKLTSATFTKKAVTSTVVRALPYSQLTSITIGSSVTSIEWLAFSGCSGLTSITIPGSVTSIGSDAFSGCSKLTSATFTGTTVTSTVVRALPYSILTSVTIPDSVTSIGNNAFYYCSGLTSITIPDSVTSIGGGAFSGCSRLTSITIPDSVTSIGGGAFSGCSRLTSITIPDSVTSIGGDAFSGCSSLTSITIPDSVTSIGSSAFKDCTGLTSVTIPDSVTSIGWRAFADCSSLTSIRFAGGTPRIDEIAFTGVTATAYYPANDATWTAAKRQNYGGTITWMPYSLSRISVKSYPAKTAYQRGEELDTDGLVLTLYYDDGSTEAVTGGYTVSGFDSGTPGEKTITVDYKGKTATFTVTVAQPIVQTVSVETLPAKLSYERNEALDTSGMTLTAVCNDGTDVITDGYTTVYDFSTTGEKTVTVSYGGKTTSFTVTVKVPVWNAIAVTTPPDKTMYEMNEALDTTGLAVSKVYSDKSSELITEGYEVSGFDSSTWGNKTVTVSYSGMSTTFTVYVGEPGDLDGNGKTTDADAIYLLMHTFFPEDYPVSGDCDYNGDGKVTDADAIYLLMYTFFPEDYPLVKPNKKEELI